VSERQPATMRDIAERTLAETHAIRALAEREAALLALVDRAAAGEVDTVDAEDALAAHLAGREEHVSVLRELDRAWSDAVARSGGTPDPTIAPLAAELAERRRTAAAEIGRADTGRAAHRAYAPAAQAPAPRFTDRRG
jgi:hypothetical protein